MSGTTGSISGSSGDTASYTVVAAEAYPAVAVNLINLYTSATPNILVNAHTLDFGTANTATGGTVSFAGGGTSTVNGQPIESGVYDGSIAGTASSPFISSSQQDTANYFAAEPGDPITFNFNQTQNFFGLLWGSADAGNTLTFTNTTTGETYTITGSQLPSKSGLQTAAGSFYVTISVPKGFNKVTVTTVNPAFEFANVIYSQNATPASGTPKVINATATSGTLCLLAGTRISTPAGERRIETLAMNELVCLNEGGTAPIRWMGVQTVHSRFADPLRVMPVRVRAGALADGVPSRDLLVSPDHALLVDGLLIQVLALVNGQTIVQETAMPEIFTYYHIELASHALILAENTPAETFIDNVDRLAFDNWAEHEALHGGTDSLAEMDLPRAKSARQIPLATRARLNARAITLFGATHAA